MVQFSPNSSQKFKFLIGAGFCTVFLSSTIALLVVFRGDGKNQFGDFSLQQDDAITFDEFLSGEFGFKTFNGSWWSDEELQWKNKEGDLVTWNFLTGETQVLVSNDLLTSFSSGTSFKGFSPDTELLLFAYDINPIWRHSFTAKYVVYNPNTNTSVTVRDKDNSDVLQYCAWVENNEFDNILIYVSGNNLYWRPDGLSETAENDVVITTSGVVDNIFNGIPDWVYEEEVLGVNYAHYINDEGNRVAFAQFDDTMVKTFQYPFYGDQNNVFESNYPTYKVVKYPKAGETNPTMNLFVWNVGEDGTKEVIPPSEVSAWGEFIYTIADWTSSDVLSVTWMNRIQNQSVISECRETESTWTCVGVFYQEQKNGWIEIMAPPVYNDKGDKFVQILPKSADNLTYPHVALVNGNITTFLTFGEFVVTEILAWDADNDQIFFMGTQEGKPGEIHFYSVPVNGNSSLPGYINCITCNIVTSRGDTCLRNSIELNWSNSYYIHTCRGPNIPESGLRKTSDNSLVYLLESNTDLEEKLSDKSLPLIASTSYNVGPNNQFSVPVKIFYPPHMDQNTQYPVLVYVYGGPGFQQVSESWTIGWGEYLATSRNIIYVLMDARGTGFQSNEFLFSVYRNLGTVEMEDQISVTRQLVNDNISIMDPKRVAIWGWSYGGFNTAMTLEQDNEDPVFKCGISVAPVTSWLLYDSIYTERYMALPSDNVQGYNHSVITGIENLKTKQWMLNHGVADDNVHFQHSMLLTKELEEHDVQFVQHSYPDENHGLRGVSRFLYHAMDNFWMNCFEI